MTSKTFEAHADQMRVGDRVTNEENGIEKRLTVATVELAGHWVNVVTPKGGHWSALETDIVTITRDEPEYETGKPYLVTKNDGTVMMMWRTDNGWSIHKDGGSNYTDTYDLIASAELLRIAGPHEAVVNVEATYPEDWDHGYGWRVAEAMREQGVTG